MKGVDWVRSWVRSAGEEVWRKLFGTEWARRVRAALADVRDWTVRVDAPGLTGALAATEGVRDLTATARQGVLSVDATLDDGSALAFDLRVRSLRFAAGGAKEIVFEIEPATARDRSATIELVATLSGLIAKLLWGRLLGFDRWTGIVPSRDGERCLRVDLREAACARAVAQGSRGMLLEVFEPESIELARGTLAIKLRRPLIHG